MTTEAPALAPLNERALTLPFSLFCEDSAEILQPLDLHAATRTYPQEFAGTLAVVEVKTSDLSPLSISINSSPKSSIAPVSALQNRETMDHLIRTQTSSMEWQLIALYGERERLEKELGVSEAEEVIALVRDLQTRSEPTQGQGAIAHEELGEPENLPDTSFSERISLTDFAAECEIESEKADLYADVPNTHFSEEIALPADRIRNAVRVLETQLQEMQTGMESQILSLYGERERLERELGISDCVEIAAIVYSLSLQRDKLCRELKREISTATYSLPHSQTRNEDRAMSTKIRGAQIASHPLYGEVQGVVEALEAQRNAQSTDLSSGDAIELDAVMRSLRNHLDDLRDTEAHLITLYAERETLTERLGTADAGQVIEIVRDLETQLRALFRESERTRTSAIPRDVFPSLCRLSKTERDALDFAVFGLDDCGTVLLANRMASELLNTSTEEMQGSNLFTQVAPCLNNRLIYGRFREGIAAGEIDESTLYTLTYKVKPMNITLHLYRDPVTRTNWLLMKKRG